MFESTFIQILLAFLTVCRFRPDWTTAEANEIIPDNNRLFKWCLVSQSWYKSLKVSAVKFNCVITLDETCFNFGIYFESGHFFCSEK